MSVLVVDQGLEIWCYAEATKGHFARSEAAFRKWTTPTVAVPVGPALNFTEPHART